MSFARKLASRALRLLRLLRPRKISRVSYSQTGEDLILAHLFDAVLGKPKINYLDVGANEPKKISNTYYFYKRGCRGICVEPNPELFRQLKRQRPGDICLNVGAGVDHCESAPFYVFTPHTLSTFSPEESRRYVEIGTKLSKVIEIPLIPLNAIIESHLPEGVDLLSLDTEGLDLSILQSLDFERHRPRVICVETISFTTGKKDTEIIDFLTTRNYRVFADTNINTIFLDHRDAAT